MLSIPLSIYHQILAHAQDAVPIEACGILSGCEGNACTWHAMTNVDASAEHFALDPAEQFAVVKAIRAAGEQMLAIVHSHPETPARPSVEDVRLALTTDVAHVIVSLADIWPQIKAFTIVDGTVTQRELVIIPDQNI